MALTQRLQLRQSQALVMTPQLMQAIKLLQLSNLDLTAYVEGELERNPLLERDGDGPGETESPQPEASAAEGDAAGCSWRSWRFGGRPESPRKRRCWWMLLLLLLLRRRHLQRLDRLRNKWR